MNNCQHFVLPTLAKLVFQASALLHACYVLSLFFRMVYTASQLFTPASFTANLHGAWAEKLQFRDNHVVGDILGHQACPLSFGP